MTRFDPIVYFSQGGSAYGDMEYSADGDYVSYDEAQAEITRLKASNKELVEAARQAYAWITLGQIGDDTGVKKQLLAAIERAKG